jgi:hypothetical protein
MTIIKRCQEIGTEKLTEEINLKEKYREELPN